MEMNVTSPRLVRELMEKYAIAPLKKYGQNFLIDGNIADKIVRTAVPEGACALEIGPGLGALTTRLVRRARAVAAYEIDAGLVGALRDVLRGAENLALHHADFLKAPIETQLAGQFGADEIYVAANLPYYITSPCIMRLLEARLNIRRVTVMVQKEVAQRICAPPGGRDYGAISAAVQYFAQPELLFNVPPSCFYPRPEVSSAVIVLRMREAYGSDAQRYLQTVRAMFAMRRKTVRSNLRQSFGMTQSQAGETLRAAGIDENARAETLSVKDFLALSHQIFENENFFM